MIVNSMMSREEYLQQLKDEEELELRKNSSLIDSFQAFVTKKNILFEITFHYERPIGIVARHKNIMKLVCLDIEQDKEGLFSWTVLQELFEKKRFMSGYLVSEDYMVMAHPYFRRNYRESNNYTPHFIDMFWRLNDEKIDAYIALDVDRVRINLDSSYYVEHDTWFGSPFNKSIQGIEDGVSKLRPPLDIDKTDIEFFFNSVFSLDIMWYTTGDNIKVFQAEEFKIDSYIIKLDGIKYYPVKYIHAEFDIELGYFRHFDGAIELYTEEEYFARREQNFNQKAKGSEQIKPNSIKLFKLNGEIAIDLWIEYISHFLSGNPLVMEYFSGEYPEHIVDALKRIREIR